MTIDIPYDCDTCLSPASMDKFESMEPVSSSDVHTENGISYR